MVERPLNVLFVASECVPLVKTGGLADVVGALPKALAAEGVDARILLPAYSGLEDRLEAPAVVWSCAALLGRPARILAGRAAGLSVLLLDIPALYHRDGGPYLDPAGEPWPDNPLRFACLSKAAAMIGRDGIGGGWRPHLLHLHDWQAGLTPLYMENRTPPAVLTIHNIGYQGLCGPGLRDVLELPADGFTPDGYEFFGQINALKAGLVKADAVTTVSPTYAREIRTPAFGMGLEGVLTARTDRVVGILNGIDLELWNPADDPAIQGFDRRRLGARTANRDALLTSFDLAPRGEAPLFGVVSRLTDQKGLDLLLEVLPGLIDRGAGLVFLGSGDRTLERAFEAMASAHPGHVGVRIGYDEALAHRFYAGCDSILVPSRFEPCGLTQLYAMRYGAPPVVARTGGLADSVIDGNDAALTAGVATGFQVAPDSASALHEGLVRAIQTFRNRRLWRRLQRNAMAHPVGWDRSAREYGALYDAILEKKAAISSAARSGSS